MAVCVAIHASGLAWAIGWLRRRPARLPGFAPHLRLFIVMAVVDRPRLRIPDAQQPVFISYPQSRSYMAC